MIYMIVKRKKEENQKKRHEGIIVKI